jgi:hypothetical protein
LFIVEIILNDETILQQLNWFVKEQLIVLTVASSEAKRAQMAELAGRVDAIRGGLTNGNAAIGRIVLDVYPEGGLLDKVHELVEEARGQG